MQVEEEIPSEFVKSYPEVLKVEGPVQAKLTITNTGDGFLLTGELTVCAKLRCSRCLKPFQTELRAVVNEEIPRKPEDAEEGEFDWEARPVLDGRELDLTSLVRETLLVSIPMKTVCREDCPGLCPPTCGADLAAGECACPPDPDTDIRLAPPWLNYCKHLHRSRKRGGKIMAVPKEDIQSKD